MPMVGSIGKLPASVEGFSVLKRLLTSSRIRLNSVTLEQLIRSCIEGPTELSYDTLQIIIDRFMMTGKSENQLSGLLM